MKASKKLNKDKRNEKWSEYCKMIPESLRKNRLKFSFENYILQTKEIKEYLKKQYDKAFPSPRIELFKRNLMYEIKKGNPDAISFYLNNQGYAIKQ